MEIPYIWGMELYEYAWPEMVAGKKIGNPR